MNDKAATYKAKAIYNETSFLIDSVPVLKGDDIVYHSAFLEAFTQNPYRAIYEGAFNENNTHDLSVAFLIEIAKDLVYQISRDPDIELARSCPLPDMERLEALKAAVPFTLGHEFASVEWIAGIYNGIGEIFNREFGEYEGTLQEYLEQKNSPLNAVGRVCFHLVEHPDENYPFAFLATYTEGSKGSVKHVPLQQAMQDSTNDEVSIKLLGLLSAVNRAADKSPFILGLIESGELFSPLRFSIKDAHTFLLETPIYEDCGVVCRVPDFWKKRPKARIKASAGSKEPAQMGLDTLLSFEPSIYLGDEEFSREEIEGLLQESRGLAFLKGKWVEVNPERLKSLLEAFEKISGEQISLADALRMQAGLDSIQIDGAEDEEDRVEITNGFWLDELRSKLANPAGISAAAPTDKFMATLRPYQDVGFNWLVFMAQTRFGALLADDMGLGKTIQVLALLDYMRDINMKTLLVIPASLISNWRNEAEKFTPELKLQILHGKSTSFDIKDADLFITTYGMTTRIAQLAETKWDMMILDEAQAIKNHGNKQTKAIKSIPAAMKIAMTGTPVENQLSDLWSVFDFLNKGLLGSQSEFSKFQKQLKTDISGYEKLRGAVGPFILRRLKTDTAIISDLPEKTQMKRYTTLTKKQIALYGELVNDLAKMIEDPEVEGIKRRGVVLSSITKFKQICNHPDQYLGGDEYSPKLSGKFEALAEICETIRDKRERVLVFTQFREMTGPIAEFLEGFFGRPGLVLHGGTSVKDRGELVAKFNNNDDYVPFMVLSLRAGGVGLNLTGANHVVHFDRWWNPAIENQATDRVFRIGQKKNVFVHKFVTSGTIEEKIDAIMEQKEELANSVVAPSSAENWITEMSNEQLMDLVRMEGI